MQNLRERLKGTTDRLRSFGGPADGLERRIMDVVERATTEMMINPDWGVNMELVDIINTEANGGCYERVFKSLRRRLTKGNNPKIQILTLTLLETCVKNTGTEFQEALAGSDFWEEVVRLADMKRKADLQVQDKVLVLVEDCAHALMAPGYRKAYDALKEAGVRFPKREPEEIGAGFNLPPTGRDASAMADVSEEDRRAIQAALVDLTTQQTAPAPPSEYRPTMESGPNTTEKLSGDLRVVANSVELLKDALGSIPLNEPELVYQDYIKDLSEQCKEMASKLKKLVESASDEKILAEALTLNDELGTVLSRYEQMMKKAVDAKKPVVQEEPALMGLDDLQPVPPVVGEVGSSSQGAVGVSAAPGSGSAVQQMPQTDPFDMLAAQSAPPAPPAPPPTSNPPMHVPPPPPPTQQRPTPNKETDPFEDLISL